MMNRWKMALSALLVGTVLLGEVLVIYGSATAGVTAATGELVATVEERTTVADTDVNSIPAAGVSLVFSDHAQVGNAKEIALRAEREAWISEQIAIAVAAAEAEAAERAIYTDVAIAQVNNYVRVRAEANTDSEVLGKLYNNSAATILETTENGWYKIKSGNVTGYVKCEYVVVGNEELAREVSTRYATVTCTTLYVRMEPTTESKILTMLPKGDDFVVVDESMRDDGWVMVTTAEGEGYVSTDYVELRTEFVTAESKEEEAARLKKEEEARRKAAAAAEAARKKKEQQSSSSSSSSSNNNYTAPTSSNGQAVVDYACQFVGNPYVYGGTSLTNGADCSGFVMSVYAAFGVSLPHSSKSLRSVGYEVSTSDMQPGDIICYSGHVAIYVGNNTVVHASNKKEGIKYTSPASYKKIICVRRIF